jgi:hypothetical protein
LLFAFSAVSFINSLIHSHLLVVHGNEMFFFSIFSFVFSKDRLIINPDVFGLAVHALKNRWTIKISQKLTENSVRILKFEALCSRSKCHKMPYEVKWHVKRISSDEMINGEEIVVSLSSML